MKTAAFYKDLLGFQMSAVAAYNGDKLMTDTAGTPGARFRQTRATIPGAPVTMTFIEFADIDRKPLPGGGKKYAYCLMAAGDDYIDRLLAAEREREQQNPDTVK